MSISRRSSFRSKLTSSSVPDDAQPPQATATDVSNGSLLGKLPKELRLAIYETVFENTLVHSEKMVEIMQPGFVGLQSLLGVSRQIRHEVQEVLQERMVRQVIFKATCYNRQEELEAANKAQSLLRGKVPGTRHVRVLMVSIDGWSSPTNPFYTSVTWRKNSVGWNL